MAFFLLSLQFDKFIFIVYCREEWKRSDVQRLQWYGGDPGFIGGQHIHQQHLT